MFRLVKKIVILVLITFSSGNIIKNVTGNFMLIPNDNFLNKPNCFLLKNEKCKVRKVIFNNDYMTFPYKIKVDKCIRSFNNKDNPYFKVCLPDSIKNISVKSFDLLSEKNVLKNISFHQNCKCGCLLDKKVCNNLQKWNKNKCRCKYVKILKYDICCSWNVNNCRCEMKILAALIESKRFLETEECKEITDDII